MKSQRPTVLKILGLGALGTVLTWQVVTRSGAASLAATAPETALRLNADQPTALLTLAARTLAHRKPAPTATAPQDQTTTQADDGRGDVSETNGVDADRLPQWSELALKATGAGAPPAPDAGAPRTAASSKSASGWTPIDPELAKEIRPWVERALINDPLNARALRMLGQLADSEERAARFMAAAAERSIGESIAVFRAMAFAYQKADFAKTLYYADTLLRTRSQYQPRVIPLLAVMAEDSAASANVKRLLADNPPWRAAFFAQLPSAITDARTPLDLLLSLRDSPAPPTPQDLQTYLNFLIARNFHELAYYAWLQFLPPDQLTKTGLLFNGSFELPPSGLPFDWTISSGSGVTIDIVSRQDRDGQRALFVEFGHGRVDFRDVTQLTMLPPGTYRLQVQYRGELLGRRGLVWRVACTGSRNDVLGESTMTTGIARDWEDMEFTFTVPETGCRAQYVRLTLDARSASERLVSGKVWYDDVRLTRVEPTKDPT